MAYFMGFYALPNRLCSDLAQTNVGTNNCRHCPRKAPTITVKHRQRPQIDRVFRHGCYHGIALC